MQVGSQDTDLSCHVQISTFCCTVWSQSTNVTLQTDVILSRQYDIMSREKYISTFVSIPCSHRLHSLYSTLWFLSSFRPVRIVEYCTIGRLVGYSNLSVCQCVCLSVRSTWAPPAGWQEGGGLPMCPGGCFPSGCLSVTPLRRSEKNVMFFCISRFVLPSWCRFTRVVRDRIQGPWNDCVCVCVPRVWVHV